MKILTTNNSLVLNINNKIMDWLKHFIVQKSEDCVRTNGLKQGLSFFDDIKYGEKSHTIENRIDNIRNGIVCVYMDDKLESITEYLNGQKHGTHKSFMDKEMNEYTGCKLYESCEYVNDKKHGIYIVWDEKQMPFLHHIYENDKLIEHIEYHDDKIQIVKYNNDKNHEILDYSIVSVKM